MPFTLKDARRELSKDVGDFFVSTAESGTTTLAITDARLSEEDNDDFVTKPSTVFVVGAQTGGPSTDEERRIADDGLSASVLTVRRAFSALASGVEYEVHRLFTGTEKNNAITKALDLVVPIVWKHIQADITVVAEQHQYDISASNFYRNDPHQANILSEDDTEHEYPVYSMETRDGTDIYFPFLPDAGRVIRLRGIGVAAIADLDAGELSIVTARAGMYLASQAKKQGPQDRRDFFAQMEQDLTNDFAERVTRFMKPAPPKNYRTEGLGSQQIDTNWRLP